MGRLKQPYIIKKKDGSKNYYYKTASMNYFKSTGLKTKREAEEYVQTVLAEESKHNVKGITNKTFGEYTKDYFVEGKCPRTNRLRSEKGDRGPSERYVKECRRLLQKKIRPTFFSNLKMKDIRRRDVLDLRDKLLEDNTPGVVNDCIAVLSLIFNEGIYREELDYNPISGINKLNENPKPKVPFTLKELKALFPIDDEKEILRIWKTFGDFILEFIEFNTGMRNSEVRCLKWKNVDLDNQIIYVREAFKDMNNKIVGPPKNGKERRTGMSDALKRMLELYKEKYTNFTAPNDFVCCYRKSGKAFLKKHSRDSHNEGLERAGVEHKGHHAYRHTFNSLLKNKVSDWDIQTTTGWSDSEIQRRYTHTEDSSLKNVREGVDGIWAEVSNLKNS